MVAKHQGFDRVLNVLQADPGNLSRAHPPFYAFRDFCFLFCRSQCVVIFLFLARKVARVFNLDVAFERAVFQDSQLCSPFLQ